MRFFLLVLLVIILITALGLISTVPKSAADKTIVSATIFPIYDITREIAGDRLEVNLLVPPGASPHIYEASPHTIETIQNSEVIFAIGSLDNWITELNNQVPVVTVNKNITYLNYEGEYFQGEVAVVPEQATSGNETHEIELTPPHEDTATETSTQEKDHDHGTLDPHYWLNIPNAIAIADQITTQLIEIDPENATHYKENFNQYQNQLTELDNEIRNSVARLPKKNIATFHNSFQYFASEYGLTIVTTFEEFPGQSPGPQYLANFTDKLAYNQVDAVYREPQLPVDKLQPLAEEYNIPFGILDPLGGSDDTQSYIELMRYNKAQLEATLQ